MPQKTQAELEEKDAFDRSEYKIPLDSELRKMSFVEMATALHGIRVGSPGYIVIDREIKKQLAQDQAQANRTNVLLGALVGGCFALAGVVLGWFLHESQPDPQVANGSSFQQTHPANLAVKPRLGSVPSDQTVASQPVNIPAKVQGNSSASKPGS